MKKYVIVAHNGNPDYSFFEPIVKMAWERIGYECITIEAVGVTESQLVRAFPHEALHWLPNDAYILTSDIDMIPIDIDYFNSQDFTKELHLFGTDLCDYKLQPMCYIGAQKHIWKFIINESFEEALKHCPTEKVSRWAYDETYFWKKFITVKNCVKVEYIKRGNTNSGAALGRVDRSGWSLDHKKIIDCHMFRQPYIDIHFNKMIELLSSYFNQSQINSIYEHRDTFCKQRNLSTNN